MLRSMNDNANFYDDVRFGNKGMSKKFTTHDSNKDVNATDELVDGAFMGSAGLVPVNQDVF